MGSREYLPEELRPGYDELMGLLDVARPDAKPLVIAFTDPQGGARVSEIGWESGRTWVRSNPDHAGVILASEKFILSHGVEASGDLDFHATDRQTLLAGLVA